MPLTVVSGEPEAEILCGLLRTNGIACSYRQTDLGAGMADASSAIGGPREILVDEEQLEQARELLPGNQ